MKIPIQRLPHGDGLELPFYASAGAAASICTPRSRLD